MIYGMDASIFTNTIMYKSFLLNNSVIIKLHHFHQTKLVVLIIDLPSV